MPSRKRFRHAPLGACVERCFSRNCLFRDGQQPKLREMLFELSPQPRSGLTCTHASGSVTVWESAQLLMNSSREPPPAPSHGEHTARPCLGKRHFRAFKSRAAGRRIEGTKVKVLRLACSCLQCSRQECLPPLEPAGEKRTRRSKTGRRNGLVPASFYQQSFHHVAREQQDDPVARTHIHGCAIRSASCEGLVCSLNMRSRLRRITGLPLRMLSLWARADVR